MAEVILVERRGSIATLTFNRPEVRNAIDQEFIGKIRDALLAIEADRDIRVLILTGAGEHFIAGGDVHFFKRSLDWSPDERRARFIEVVHRIHPVVLAIRRMPQPVIASVRGAAAGWGVSLILACDLAIAADNARFSLAYSGVGATPEGSGSWFLPRTVGAKKAMELTLLKDRIDASEALALGIVNRIVPLPELSAGTNEWADKLAVGPSVAIAETKRLFNSAQTSTLEAQLNAEALAWGECAATEDFAEGARAFLERRKPVFKGR